MSVTNIVNRWLSGSIPNYGFIIKRPNPDESGSAIFGKLKFFGRDTHTIYVPRLEAAWDNTNLSGTASFTEISSDTYVLNFKNIRNEYQADGRAKFRVAVRPEYPTKAYVTSSWYLTDNRLPTSSFYSIKDTVTNETIIPYDTDATRISCDSNGNYIDLRLNAFQPDRYYKFALKVERDGGNEIQIHDDGFYFKVAK